MSYALPFASRYDTFRSFSTSRCTQSARAMATFAKLESDSWLARVRCKGQDDAFIERLWRSLKHEDVFARRFGTGQFQHSGDGSGRKRSPAGLARLVAREPIDALLAVWLLPASAGRGRLAPALRATSATGHRSAEKMTISARCTCLSGRFRSPMMASKRSRPSAATMTLTVWARPPDSHIWRSV